MRSAPSWWWGADGRRSRMASEVGCWQPYRGSLNGRGFAFRYLDDPRVGTLDGETIGVYRAGDATCLVLPSRPLGRMLVVFIAPSDDIPRFQQDVEKVWAVKVAEDLALAERLEGATNADKLRATTSWCRSTAPRAARAGRWPGMPGTSRTRWSARDSGTRCATAGCSGRPCAASSTIPPPSTRPCPAGTPT